MVPASEYFRSVELIWPLWLASVVLLALLTYRCLSGFRWTRWRRLLRQEKGAAYSLAYVMTVPLYMLLVCLVIETSLILVVKIGTVYAAFAAARSAAVWLPVDAATGQQRAQLAAVQALAPFGSGNPIHSAGGQPPPGGSISDYVAAYQRYGQSSGSWIGTSPYIKSKYLCAAKGLSLDVHPGTATDPTNATFVTAALTYDMPMNVPGIARLLNTKLGPGGKYRVYTIRTTVTLTQSVVKDLNTPGGNPLTQPFGIAYSPLKED